MCCARSELTVRFRYVAGVGHVRGLRDSSRRALGLRLDQSGVVDAVSADAGVVVHGELFDARRAAPPAAGRPPAGAVEPGHAAAPAQARRAAREGRIPRQAGRQTQNVEEALVRAQEWSAVLLEIPGNEPTSFYI